MCTFKNSPLLHRILQIVGLHLIYYMKDVKDGNFNVNGVNLEMNQINFYIKNNVIGTILV